MRSGRHEASPFRTYSIPCFHHHTDLCLSLRLGRERMLPASRCGSLSESHCITQTAPCSFHPNPSLASRVGTKKFCLVYLRFLLFCLWKLRAFYLEFGSNFSNYAKTIFPYFLVLMCKSLSQMLKNPMTSGERNFYYMAQLPVTSLSLGKCDPQGSITPLGGR